MVYHTRYLHSFHCNIEIDGGSSAYGYDYDESIYLFSIFFVYRAAYMLLEK